MRDLSLKALLVFLLLFSSIENGVYPSSSNSHDHSDEAPHVAPQDGANSEFAVDDHDHCSSCCFGHLAVNETRFQVFYSDLQPDEPFAMLNRYFIPFAQAPPTPPPNA